MKTFKNLTLPFEEQFLLEAVHLDVGEVDPEVVYLLNYINWSKYEIDIIAALLYSTKMYVGNFDKTNTDPIYQIAVCTNALTCRSSINFETRPHALERLQNRTSWWRENGHVEIAEAMSKLEYNPNQADFKYWGFHGVGHPELKPLQTLNLDDEDVKNAAETYIERSLLRVVDRIANEDVLADLPQENEVWVGVSSPHDWYDHVKPIRKHRSEKVGQT